MNRPAYTVTLEDGRVIEIPEFTYNYKRDLYISKETWEKLTLEKYLDPDYAEIPF